MSNFKLTVHLKQITPLLHFQGDTEGACLRASEVKPKLDKFVLSYLKQTGVAIPKSWILKAPDGEDETKHPDALRYKMRFEGVGKVEAKATAHISYFGNQGDNKSNFVQGVLFPEGITMTLLILEKAVLETPIHISQGNKAIEKLKDVLDYLIPYFFCFYSFGRRSNKGFGSFVVEREKPLNPDELTTMMPKDYDAMFVMNRENGYPEPYSQLNDIYVVSAMMKGGVNGPFDNSPYFKGKVQTSLRHGLDSEKVFMKEAVFTPNQKRIYDRLCKARQKGEIFKISRYAPRTRYVRAMLGLTDTFTFGIADKKAKIEQDYFIISVKDKESDKEKQIERFANPLFFKPIDGQTLLFVRKIPNAMYGHPFLFNGKETKTPSVDEFNLLEFVRGFVRIFNNKNFKGEWRNLDRGTYWAFRKPFRYGDKAKYSDTLEKVSITEIGGN